MSLKKTLRTILQTSLITVPLTIATALSLQAQDYLESSDYHNERKYQKYIQTNTHNGKIALDKKTYEEKLQKYGEKLKTVRSDITFLKKNMASTQDISKADKKRAIILQAQKDKQQFTTDTPYVLSNSNLDVSYDAFVQKHPFIEKKTISSNKSQYVVTDIRFFDVNLSLLEDSTFFSFYQNVYSDLFSNKISSDTFDFHLLLSNQRDLVTDSTQTKKILTYIDLIAEKKFLKAKNFAKTSLFGPYAKKYSEDVQIRIEERNQLFTKELQNEETMQKVYRNYTRSGSLNDYVLFCSHCKKLESFAKENGLLSDFNTNSKSFCDEANAYVLKQKASFDIDKILSSKSYLHHFVDDLLFSQKDVFESLKNDLYTSLSSQNSITFYDLKRLFDNVSFNSLSTFNSTLQSIEKIFESKSLVYNSSKKQKNIDFDMSFSTDSVLVLLDERIQKNSSKIFLEYADEVLDTCLNYSQLTTTDVSSKDVAHYKNNFSKRYQKHKKNKHERHVFLESKRYGSDVLSLDKQSPTGFYWTDENELVVVKNISVPLPKSPLPAEYQFERNVRKTLEEELLRYDEDKFSSGLNKNRLDWDFYIYDIQNTPVEKKISGNDRFLKAYPLNQHMVQVRVIYDISRNRPLKKFCKDFIGDNVSLDDNLTGILYEDKINSVDVCFSADKEGARLFLEKADSIVQVVDTDANVFSSFSKSSNYADGAIVQTYIGKKKHGDLSAPNHLSLDDLYVWPDGTKESYAQVYERIVSKIISSDPKFLKNQQEKLRYISR
ncbi:MAG: hypothetical protein ACOCQQ_00140 [Candidatus Nanoarchaeia archaeon]